jgi:hypothetical protein
MNKRSKFNETFGLSNDKAINWVDGVDKIKKR